jgi:hypothetical protein
VKSGLGRLGLVQGTNPGAPGQGSKVIANRTAIARWGIPGGKRVSFPAGRENSAIYRGQSFPASVRVGRDTSALGKTAEFRGAPGPGGGPDNLLSGTRSGWRLLKAGGPRGGLVARKGLVEETLLAATQPGQASCPGHPTEDRLKPGLQRDGTGAGHVLNGKKQANLMRIDRQTATLRPRRAGVAR